MPRTKSRWTQQSRQQLHGFYHTSLPVGRLKKKVTGARLPRTAMLSCIIAEDTWLVWKLSTWAKMLCNALPTGFLKAWRQIWVATEGVGRGNSMVMLAGQPGWLSVRQGEQRRMLHSALQPSRRRNLLTPISHPLGWWSIIPSTFSNQIIVALSLPPIVKWP